METRDNRAEEQGRMAREFGDARDANPYEEHRRTLGDSWTDLGDVLITAWYRGWDEGTRGSLPVDHRETEAPPPPVKEWHPSKGDRYKGLFDFFKHLTTLSAGSIVLIVTLLEKVFHQPKSGELVTASVGGFVVCLVATMLAYMVFVLNFPGPDADPPTEGEKRVMVTSMLIGAFAFVFGIIALALFFALNWNR